MDHISPIPKAAAFLCLMFLAGCNSERAVLRHSNMVRPTSTNIIMASSDFDALTIARKVKIGMIEAEVIKAMGQPKEVKLADDMNSWFYTYEFPDKSAQDKWVILMIQFKAGKAISEGLWLPNG